MKTMNKPFFINKSSKVCSKSLASIKRKASLTKFTIRVSGKLCRKILLVNLKLSLNTQEILIKLRAYI